MMMKKLLVLMLVLGMGSMASATLTLFTGLGPDAMDNAPDEITIQISDYIWIGIHSDEQGEVGGDTGQYRALIAIPPDAQIPGNRAGGHFTGQMGMDPQVVIPSATVGFLAGHDNYIVEAMNTIGSLEYANPGLGFWGEFHCDALGDVVIRLVDTRITGAASVVDVLTIHQIPEPMTFGLLGLGALLLRRRK